MNIYNLRYFVTLARIRQYTKAAEELCITQPSLSHAISQMEKELGVKLFEKNGHKITLTQFGEEFLSYAEKTLDVLDDGIASIKRTLLVETAEKPEEIDVRRAEEAKQRAEERLRQKQSIHEYYHSRAALARAMARLKATSGK